jgi:hypothetical protein
MRGFLQAGRGQEPGEVVRAVMDEIGGRGGRVGADQDGGHAQQGGRGEVLLAVLEEGGQRAGDGVAAC